MRRSSAFLVCSEIERRAALTAVPEANVRVLENGVSDEQLRPSPIPCAPRAYFVGMLDYRPNYEGLHWLATHVWPLVAREVPNAELLVAGSRALPAAVLEALRAHSGITFLGEVESVAAVQRDARVALVPILSGGGTRLKLLEAAAGGRAVVTTPIGAEGLDLPGFVTLCSTAEEFAQATVRRLVDDSLARREGEALADWAAGMRWEMLVRRTLLPILAETAGAHRGVA